MCRGEMINLNIHSKHFIYNFRKVCFTMKQIFHSVYPIEIAGQSYQ